VVRGSVAAPIPQLVGQVAAEPVQHREVDGAKVIEKGLVDELIVDTEEMIVRGAPGRGPDRCEIEPVLDELGSPSELGVRHLPGAR